MLSWAHIRYLVCLSRTVLEVYVDVSERQDDVMALHLPNRSVKHPLWVGASTEMRIDE